MKIKMQWVVLVLTLYGATAWECGNHPQSELEPEFVEVDSPRKLGSRSEELKPIRIHVHYHEFDLGSSDRNNYFKNEVMNATLEWFSSVLLVHPLENKLKMSLSTCGGVPVPEEHSTEGVNADVIVYITSKYEPDEGWAAYAGACALQGRSPNNVIAGRASVNKAQFVNFGFEAQMSVMIHEISHLLAFSKVLFNYFRKPDGNRYSTGEFTISEVVRGTEKLLVKSPTVLNKAREIFGCSSLEGVELENQGGSGTAGSHWEMRVMFNDYMNSHVVDDPVYSSLTLSLFEDSGWYKVNWDYTQDNIWGRGKGCTFHADKCVENGIAKFPEFCVSSGRTCDTFHLYKGYCNIASFDGALPEHYQYFSDPSIGGRDSYVDYCPIKQGYSNGSCRGTGGSSTSTLSIFHESVGPNSRCLEGTLIEKGWRLSGDPYHTACYEVVECLEDRAYVRVWDDIVVCPFTGAQIEVSGMNGYLVCPDSDILCSDIPCMNGCYGRGKCNKGVCECREGFGGPDCSKECGPSCSNCEETNPNVCLSCRDPNAVLQLDGTCECKTGYLEVNGVCESQCPELCDFCDDDGNCIECIANAIYVGTNTCECENGFERVQGQCSKECGINCKKCSVKSGQCLECTQHASVVNGYCQCDEGFIDSGFGECIGFCPELCLDCNYSTFECSSCVKNAYLSEGNCKCEPGFVNHNGYCIKECQSLCESCDYEEGKCNVCKKNSFLNQKGFCECKKGYKDNGLGTCILDCGPLCKECQESTQKCLACNDQSYLTQEGTCECLQGYQKKQGSCYIKCSKQCDTCEPDDPNTCTTCKPNALLQDGKCICKQGFKMNEIGHCVSECSALCESCNSGVCSACKKNSHLHSDGSCVCKEGFEEVDGRCFFKCPKLCDACSLTEKYCTECKSGAQKTQEGLCKCPEGSQEVDGECKGACNGLCKTCSEDKLKCLTCKAGGLITQEGFCQCGEGLAPTKNGCESKCDALCSYCDYKSQSCLACVSYSRLVEGKCECLPGFKRVAGHCQAICNSLCIDCASCDGSLCTKCVENARLSESLECVCREGYYEDSGSCKPICPELCSDCEGRVCSMCKKNAHLQNGTCYCKEGFKLHKGECITN